MVTFHDARLLVGAILARSWGPEDGTLVVLADGTEDARHWNVIAGARESLVGDDLAFLVMDAPAYLMDKATGGLTEAVVIENLDRLHRMTPVRDPAGDLV